jgi:hypothetical protein
MDGKNKVKFLCIIKYHSMMVYEEWRYNSMRSLLFHYLDINSQLHGLAVLFPGKEPPVPIGLDAKWAPEPIWTLWR